MKRFYIVYLDTSHIEGKVTCTEEEFVRRFITPLEKEISSYYLASKESILIKEEFSMEKLNDII